MQPPITKSLFNPAEGYTLRDAKRRPGTTGASACTKLARAGETRRNSVTGSGTSCKAPYAGSRINGQSSARSTLHGRRLTTANREYADPSNPRTNKKTY